MVTGPGEGFSSVPLPLRSPEYLPCSPGGPWPGASSRDQLVHQFSPPHRAGLLHVTQNHGKQTAWASTKGTRGQQAGSAPGPHQAWGQKPPGKRLLEEQSLCPHQRLNEDLSLWWAHQGLLGSG